jgi:hypothetical protein
MDPAAEEQLAKIFMGLMQKISIIAGPVPENSFREYYATVRPDDSCKLRLAFPSNGDGMITQAVITTRTFAPVYEVLQIQMEGDEVAMLYGQAFPPYDFQFLRETFPQELGDRVLDAHSKLNYLYDIDGRLMQLQYPCKEMRPQTLAFFYSKLCKGQSKLRETFYINDMEEARAADLVAALNQVMELGRVEVVDEILYGNRVFGVMDGKTELYYISVPLGGGPALLQGIDRIIEPYDVHLARKEIDI